MGCKCKDTAKAAAKYSNDTTVKQLTGIKKGLMIGRQILTYILVILLFIIAIPFLIILAISKMVKGKKITVNISKIIKVFHVKSE